MSQFPPHINVIILNISVIIVVVDYVVALVCKDS